MASKSSSRRRSPRRRVERRHGPCVLRLIVRCTLPRLPPSGLRTPFTPLLSAPLCDLSLSQSPMSHKMQDATL